MRLDDERESDNVEDMRDASGGTRRAGVVVNVPAPRPESKALRRKLKPSVLAIPAIRLDEDDRSARGREHHHTHDALGINALAVTREPNLGGKTSGGLRELDRRPCMQPELIDNLKFPLQHWS